jgi:hypothetical protein
MQGVLATTPWGFGIAWFVAVAELALGGLSPGPRLQFNR